MGKIAKQKEQTQATSEEREEGRGLGGREEGGKCSRPADTQVITEKSASPHPLRRVQ